jgi:hypothetical protein
MQDTLQERRKSLSDLHKSDQTIRQMVQLLKNKSDFHFFVKRVTVSYKQHVNKSHGLKSAVFSPLPMKSSVTCTQQASCRPAESTLVGVCSQKNLQEFHLLLSLILHYPGSLQPRLHFSHRSRFTNRSSGAIR